MQDLRLVERRDQSLILESEDGLQYILDVNEEVFATVQSIHRSQQAKSADTKVRPREVQMLLREGVSREEVAERLQIDRDDVERYAGPIDAEFAFILEQALSVGVRADVHSGDEPQYFGQVIEERLTQLGANHHEWKTWRHPDDGWMVALAFSAHGVDHEAIWAFEHRKRLLSPVTPDAVNLSKQGDVGDKLIPTLRAVDKPEERTEFDAEPFDQAAHEPSMDDSTDLTGDLPEFTKTDFERRLGIEQRAIATEPEPQDLGQTSDLLDALRKRRQDRDAVHSEPDTHTPEGAADPPASSFITEDEPVREPINIWARPADPGELTHDAASKPPSPPFPSPAEPSSESDDRTTDKKAKKGRQSIPSWDEILFGTRSDEDS